MTTKYHNMETCFLQIFAKYELFFVVIFFCIIHIVNPELTQDSMPTKPHAKLNPSSIRKIID